MIRANLSRVLLQLLRVHERLRAALDVAHAALHLLLDVVQHLALRKDKRGSVSLCDRASTSTAMSRKIWHSSPPLYLGVG